MNKVLLLLRRRRRRLLLHKHINYYDYHFLGIVIMLVLFVQWDTHAHARTHAYMIFVGRVLPVQDQIGNYWRRVMGSISRIMFPVYRDA